MRSINETLSLLQKFGECSGLKINKDKTTGMLLGSWKNRRNLPQIINWTKNPIKLLGIFISNNSNETVMTNFESKVAALLRQLHWWKATQQTKLYYRNIIYITILSFAVFNISSAYYGNVAQENTTFTNITLPNNII